MGWPKTLDTNGGRKSAFDGRPHHPALNAMDLVARILSGRKTELNEDKQRAFTGARNLSPLITLAA